MCSCKRVALRIASFTTMSSTDNFSFSVANRKPGLSAPETPVLTLAVARRFEQGQRIEPGEAWRGLRNVEVDRIEFRNPDAAGPCQPLQRRDRLSLAAEIGRERNRVFRRHQRFRDRSDPLRLDTARLHAAV